MCSGWRASEGGSGRHSTGPAQNHRPKGRLRAAGKRRKKNNSVREVWTHPRPHPRGLAPVPIYKQMLISVEKSISRVSGEHLWCLLAESPLWTQAGKFLHVCARDARFTYCFLWALLGVGLQYQHQKKTSGLGLPDLANKNTEHPVKFKSQKQQKGY